jgi:hypothetical protein
MEYCFKTLSIFRISLVTVVVNGPYRSPERFNDSRESPVSVRFETVLPLIESESRSLTALTD